MACVRLCSWICPQRYQSCSFRHSRGLDEGTLYQIPLQGRLKRQIPSYSLRGSWVEQWWWSKLAWPCWKTSCADFVYYYTTFVFALNNYTYSQPNSVPQWITLTTNLPPILWTIHSKFQCWYTSCERIYIYCGLHESKLHNIKAQRTIISREFFQRAAFRLTKSTSLTLFISHAIIRVDVVPYCPNLCPRHHRHSTICTIIGVLRGTVPSSGFHTSHSIAIPLFQNKCRILWFFTV